VGYCAALRRSASPERFRWRVTLLTCFGKVPGSNSEGACCRAQVLAYIEAGGDLSRRLSASEVSVLSHDNSRMITPGMLRARDSLVDICLRLQREDMLKLLCPNEVPQGAIKRLPSHSFPLEASLIVKDISGGLEASLTNGSYDARALGYLQLNFALPCEIRSLADEARRTALVEIVDVDARDTLEDPREPVINWFVNIPCPRPCPSHLEGCQPSRCCNGLASRTCCHVAPRRLRSGPPAGVRR
jgi:hypothetical protein